MGLFTRRQSDEDSKREQELAQPPKSASTQSLVGFETVLGIGGVMEGTLTSEGNVRLDGEFSGTLNITGNILVGETAKINADIDARNISIAGAVRGNVSGNKVQLLRTGRIWGDIFANALTTEEGAFIDGKITMQDHSANQPEVENIVDEAPQDSDTQAGDDNDTMPTVAIEIENETISTGSDSTEDETLEEAEDDD